MEHGTENKEMTMSKSTKKLTTVEAGTIGRKMGVLGLCVYRDDIDDFETVLAASGGDLKAAIARIGDAASAAPKGKALDAVKALARRRDD